MKEITVKKYQTSDGCNFDSKTNAITHQSGLDVSKSIDNYINAINTLRKIGGDDPLTERRVSHITNVVTEWEAWNAVVEAKSNDKPVAVAE